ncbi:hypothetical protein [Tsukamurella tyrosinosolvens]|uniref:hypothetical protein n=1 Tax=Tsukamurella tyrosinosolvens TaxID=57704 RepID=UPI003F4A5806
MTNTPPVSEFDQTRFVREIIAAAGPGGIPEDDVLAALEQFIEMNIDAAAISMWHKGEIKFAWQNGDMVWSFP